MLISKTAELSWLYSGPICNLPLEPAGNRGLTIGAHYYHKTAISECLKVGSVAMKILVVKLGKKPMLKTHLP